MGQKLISKEQFDLLFDGKDQVFVLEKVGKDYKYVYVNESANAYLQCNAAEKLLSEVLSTEVFEKSFDTFERAIKERQQIDCEDYSSFSKEIKKHEITVKPIFQEDRIYVLVTIKELLCNRSIEDKLMFMRSIFTNTFFSTIILSKEGKVLEVNPKFTDDFGLTTEKLKGKCFLEMPFHDQSGFFDFEKNLKQAAQGETISSSVSTFIGSGGEKRFYLTTFTPIENEEDVAAIFIILQDITDYLLQKLELRSTSHGLESFKEAMNSAADISIADINGTIVDVNDEFLKTCRYEREEVLGQTYQILNSRYHSEEFFQDMWDTLLRGEIWRGEVCNRSKFGEYYWVDGTIIPLKDETGVIHQFLTVNYNITDKKRIMTELKNIERRFRIITENTNDLIVITNEDGIILYSSPSYSKRLGYSKVELEGRFYTDILAEESKDIWSSIFTNLDKTLEDNSFDLLLKTKDGQLVWTDCLMSTVHDIEHGDRFQFVMISREITQRKELEKQLMFMAFHDTLTQLPNRRFLMKEFPKMLEEANAHHCSIGVLFVDGDDFKLVNDKYGHEIGDKFIKNFGVALSNCLRTHDLVVRIGGDEFIVVLTSLTMDIEKRNKQMELIIERIQTQLAQGWEIDGIKFAPTSSIGVAYYPDHAERLEKLLDIADHALYEAKKSKNSVIIADNSLDSSN